MLQHVHPKELLAQFVERRIESDHQRDPAQRKTRYETPV
jgi:hypothetical protein